MVYYVETLTGGEIESRVAAPGENLADVLTVTAHSLREAGVMSAQLLEAPANKTKDFGVGRVVATFTDADSWKPVPN